MKDMEFALQENLYTKAEKVLDILCVKYVEYDDYKEDIKNFLDKLYKDKKKPN